MTFYRYELIQSISYDESDEPSPRLILRKFTLVKETRCGYWISDGGKKRFVLKKSKRRFAYPTEEEAMTNFIKRTERRIAILRWQLDFCETGLMLTINNQPQTKEGDTQ